MAKVTQLYMNDPDLIRLASVSGTANTLVKYGRKICFVNIRDYDGVFADSEGHSGISFHPVCTENLDGIKRPGGGVINVNLFYERKGNIFRNITSEGDVIWTDGYFEGTEEFLPNDYVGYNERVLGVFLAGNDEGTFMEGFVFGVVDKENK